MAKTTFAPTTVIDSSKIFDPTLQSQMQQVAFAKNQVENLQSGISSIAKNIGQIKMAGEQNDQIAMRQMQDKLSKDWTDAMVKYQGNIPVDQQIKFQGALNGLNNLADMYAEDKKTVDQLRNQMTSAFSKGNITRESWDRFQKALVQRQSLPVWERTPINLPDYMEQKPSNEPSIMKKLLDVNPYKPGVNKETGEVLYDNAKSRSSINTLIDSDKNVKQWYVDIMSTMGLDPEKDRKQFLDIYVGLHREQYPNNIEKTDEQGRKRTYNMVKVPGINPPPGTPTEEAAKLRTGYGEIPIMLKGVPHKGDIYDVVGVRVYPNGQKDAVVQRMTNGILKKEVIPYNEISAAMLNIGQKNKAWTKKDDESIGETKIEPSWENIQSFRN